MLCSICGNIVEQKIRAYGFSDLCKGISLMEFSANLFAEISGESRVEYLPFA